MPGSESAQKLNEDLARRINEEARSNPQSPYAGKWVGLANGQVVIVADNADDVVRRLEEVEPDMWKRFCWEAGLDYKEVQEIWKLL